MILNVAPVIDSPARKQHLRLNDIRGMAVVYEGKEFTLNFDQQNEAALLLDASVPVSKEAASTLSDAAPFEKIRIYMFGSPTVEVDLLGFSGGDLIFSMPAWNPAGYLKDTSNGAFKNLLNQTVDK